MATTAITRPAPAAASRAFPISAFIHTSTASQRASLLDGVSPGKVGIIRPMAKDDSKARILERAEREQVKFMRLQFTDILGATKNVEVPDRQFGEALDGRIMFDGSSIEGFVRTEESDMYLKPDLSTFQVLPWTYAGSERVGRVICDIANPDGTPFAGCPRSTLKRAIDLASSKGFAMRAGPEAEFFLFQRRAGRAADHRDPRLRGLLRPDAGGSRRGRAARDRALAGADGVSRRGRAPRGGARTARDRLPARRRAAHGRQRQHVPVRGEERRQPPRPARHVHAQAGLRRQRQRHAHPPVAVLARAQRVLRREGGAPAERIVPALRGRPAQTRQGLLRRHQPARELVQAAGARLRGAHRHRVVRAQPQPAHPRAGRARRRRRASSCACPTPRAIRTWR